MANVIMYIMKNAVWTGSCDRGSSSEMTGEELLFRKEEMFTVVVIDGLADNHHAYLADSFLEQYVFGENGQMIIRKSNYGEPTGHGTAICSIIARNCTNVRIVNIGIMDWTLKVSIDLLIKALQYVCDNIKCEVINMSLGSLYPNKTLENMCEKLYQKGIILVAAFDNAGSVSYPAAYSCVIGVDTSYKCVKNDDFVYVENSIVNIKAKGGNQRVAWVNPPITINQGASFAAAYVTAAVVRMIQQGVVTHQILEKFKINARYCYEFDKKDCCTEVLKISKAAILPYNKEVHSVVLFHELLSFELVDVYDIRESGNVGRILKDLNGNMNYTIKNCDRIDFTNIDTLIIGHVGELEDITHRNLKEELIRKCITNHVNIYSFDKNVIADMEKSCCGQIEILYPHLEKRADKFGKLYKIKRPVLAVFGTAKQQGKYTLQLQLRKAFLKRGYQVGQLGTEPSAKLFGMDEMYPFGYAGERFTGKEEIEYVNNVIHEIDIKNPDIIIAGSQSGTVPRLYNNTGQIPEAQLNFLMGVNPDAVILCVNIDDSMSYIRRTIAAIEAIGNCKVILIGIYPQMFADGWGIISGKKKQADKEKIECFKELLQQEFGIASVVIREESEEDKLVQICIDFFRKREH